MLCFDPVLTLLCFYIFNCPSASFPEWVSLFDGERKASRLRISIEQQRRGLKAWWFECHRAFVLQTATSIEDSGKVLSRILRATDPATKRYLSLPLPLNPISSQCD